LDTTICYCFGVTRGEICTVIREHKCTTPEEIGERCQAGRGCHSCVFDLEELIEEVQAEDRRQQRAGRQASA